MAGDTAILDYPFARKCPFHAPEELAAFRQDDGLGRVRLWNGETAWLAARYDDVREILSATEFSTVVRRPGYPFVSEARKALLLAERPNITFMDPPEHPRFRRMLSRLFTVQRVQALRPQIEELVEHLLDEMLASGGPADFVDSFSMELPVHVVARLVGVPAKDHELFTQAAKARFDLSASPEVPINAARLLWDYLGDLVRRKVDDPVEGDDITTRLVIDYVIPGKMTYEDAVMIVNQLLVAGHDTTANMIAMGTILLLENPEQLAMIRENPERIPAAIDEMLRYLTVLHFHASRTAIQDMEIRGCPVAEGEGVIASLIGANHDPAMFPEPQRFDIMRDAAAHVAFGYGPHQCLGQPLARLELKVVFERLFTKIPTLRLVSPSEQMQYTPKNLSFGPERMMVMW